MPEVIGDWMLAHRHRESEGWGAGLVQIALFGLLLLTGMPALAAQTSFEVRHDHDPFGQCKGQLQISDAGITFESNKEKHSRSWSWIDIQSFDRISESKFAILTWEDERRFLGLDRYFHFSILDDSRATNQVVALVREHLPGTVTDRIPESLEQTEYQIPVKHLHAFDGCEGILSFGPDWIVFQSDNPKHSRTWKRDAELESVWSLNRYHLELHVFEENRRGFDKTKNFRFQLKRPLDRDYYERLRAEMRVEW